MQNVKCHTPIDAALCFCYDNINRAVPRNVLDSLLWDHSKLFSITLNPSGYKCWKEFAIDYQAVSLLRKYDGLDLAIDRAAVAVQAFLKSEDVCVSSSKRLYSAHEAPEPIRTILLRARAWIAKVLGEFNWNEVLPLCDFGPGASLGVKKSRAHKWYKIGNIKPTVTRECAALYEALRLSDPLYKRVLAMEPTIVDGSTVTTVPKDARKDRLIAIEPLMNMFFQKGIGGIIRRRLRAVGLNLNQQQPINQRLAREGSIDGRLATLDLSAASDSISLGLVHYLLPEDWVGPLLLTRSKTTRLPDGRLCILEKISSMGNGYTFELETLLFLALALASSKGSMINRDVSVYGDDIILPVRDCGTLIEVLDYCGFKTNSEKSFTSGPFRESCGKHYFSGNDVTPLYLRKKISSPSELLVVVNNIRRAASRLGSNLFCDFRWKRAYDLYMSRLPGRLRDLSIPDGVGDEGVVRDFDECSPVPKRAGNHVEGYTCRVFHRQDKPIRGTGFRSLLLSLRGLEHLDVSGVRVSLAVRGRCARYIASKIGDSNYRANDISTGRCKYFVSTLTVTQWTTLGPWA